MGAAGAAVEIKEKIKSEPSGEPGEETGKAREMERSSGRDSKKVEQQNLSQLLLINSGSGSTDTGASLAALFVWLN